MIFIILHFHVYIDVFDYLNCFFDVIIVFLVSEDVFQLNLVPFNVSVRRENVWMTLYIWIMLISR